MPELLLCVALLSCCAFLVFLVVLLLSLLCAPQALASQLKAAKAVTRGKQAAVKKLEQRMQQVQVEMKSVLEVRLLLRQWGLAGPLWGANVSQLWQGVVVVVGNEGLCAVRVLGRLHVQPAGCCLVGQYIYMAVRICTAHPVAGTLWRTRKQSLCCCKWHSCVVPCCRSTAAAAAA